MAPERPDPLATRVPPIDPYRRLAASVLLSSARAVSRAVAGGQEVDSREVDFLLEPSPWKDQLGWWGDDDQGSVLLLLALDGAVSARTRTGGGPR